MKKIINIKLLITFTILSTLLIPTVVLAVIQSLNGLTGQTQTFQNDSNVTISPSNNIHSLGWQGQLPISRGGTGANLFSNGSILFSNSTAIIQDNSNLFWDDINNWLGIGTSAPATTLDVFGNASISGTLNVTGNITSTNLVPYTGATSDVDLGNHNLTLGAENSGIFITAPDATTNNTNGGDLTIFSGMGLGTGNAGNLEFIGNDGGANGGNGGDVSFVAGDGNNGGIHGTYKFWSPEGRVIGILDTSFLATSDKIFTFPNVSGTFGLIEIDQTWSGLNRFEANTNSTIYVGSSVKSGCIVIGDSDGSGVTYVTANDGVLAASASKPSICQ